MWVWIDIISDAYEQFAHKEDLLLVSGSMNRVQARFQPLSPGLKQVVVHAVDTDERRLVAAWRVGVMCSMPDVAKSYDIILRVGKGVNKVCGHTSVSVLRRKVDCSCVAHLLPTRKLRTKTRGRSRSRSSSAPPILRCCMSSSRA